jgi:hypothetical protein
MQLIKFIEHSVMQKTENYLVRIKSLTILLIIHPQPFPGTLPNAI